MLRTRLSMENLRVSQMGLRFMWMFWRKVALLVERQLCSVLNYLSCFYSYFYSGTLCAEILDGRFSGLAGFGW
jgi:hypothetical protein